MQSSLLHRRQVSKQANYKDYKEDLRDYFLTRHLEVLLRRPGSKTHQSKIFQSIAQLKVLKESYEDALRQIAKQRCAAGEQEPDPAKSTQLRDRQKYLASLKQYTSIHLAI
jgi:hypothetical protein